jgi:hypothetical protein
MGHPVPGGIWCILGFNSGQNRAKSGKYRPNPEEIPKNLWKSRFFD